VGLHHRAPSLPRCGERELSPPGPVSCGRSSLPSRSITITAHAEATAVATAAAAAIADKKGEDILLLDVSDLVVVTDVFVIATGTSNRHVKTLIEEVEYQLETGMDRRVLRREGEDFGKWVLLDYGDVVVHVFDRETRDYYELERLWADAPLTEVESATAEA
jgi:ribosome-associated protein